VKNKLAHAFLGGTTLVALLVVNASPAHAATYSWKQLPNTRVTYYLPGGPQATYLSDCMVETWVNQDSMSAQVNLKLYSSVQGAAYGTHCAPSVGYPFMSSVSIVVSDGVNIRADDPQTVQLSNAGASGYYNQGVWWGRASNYTGSMRYLGAHLSATNTSGMTWYWDISAY
jgi:hypothetical protein